MFIREAHVIRCLQANDPDLEFGVSHISAGDTSLSSGGTRMFSVSGDSKNPEVAWRFAEFLRGDRGYDRYAGIGGIIPETRSIAALPHLSENPNMGVFLSQPVKPVNAFPRINRATNIPVAYVERYCYRLIEADHDAWEVDCLMARRNPTNGCSDSIRSTSPAWTTKPSHGSQVRVAPASSSPDAPSMDHLRTALAPSFAGHSPRTASPR